MEQMQRYIRFARTIHPKITVESQRVLVDCYRRLRQGDISLGRSRAAYRITVRQLESMIRLSEALARLHCDEEIQPAYVREAFRLLKTSIIQVETNDVDVEDDEEDDDGGDNDDNNNNNDDNNDHPDQRMEESESQGLGETDEPETQPRIALHPGEFRSDDVHPAATAPPAAGKQESMSEGPAETGKPSKKKTKISFEEYEAMANAIATHLRSLERDTEDESGSNESPSSSSPRYLKWKDVVAWYLEQMESEFSSSVEQLEVSRKKVNLVIRRLLTKEMVLVTVGGPPPQNKREEQNTLLAVHPNYVVP
jgi:DNA replication licensing factor MCM6